MAFRLFARKSVDQLLEEVADEEHGLRQALGPLNLVALGVGAIIGGGIFVLTRCFCSIEMATVWRPSSVRATCTVPGARFGRTRPLPAQLRPGNVHSAEGWEPLSTPGPPLCFPSCWQGFGAAPVAVGWSGYVTSFRPADGGGSICRAEHPGPVSGGPASW